MNLGKTQGVLHQLGIPDVGIATDVDPEETREWLESLADVLERHGPERARVLLSLLRETAFRAGVSLPFTANTPYINSIPVDKQPHYPGNRDKLGAGNHLPFFPSNQKHLPHF